MGEDNEPQIRLRVDHHLYLHLDGEPIRVHLTTKEQPPFLTTARLAIGEKNMGAQLNVDSVNKTLTLQFDDDKGDTDAAAPPGLDPPVYGSDNEASATVASDPSNPLVADITVVAEGAGNFTVAPLTVNGGTPLTEADGTPFPTPTAEPFTVGPGAAVAAGLVLNP